jgi:hypothetical protein
MVPTPARRNHYFYGKILDVGDLEIEQDYGRQKRRLINRLTLGYGVVDGFSVGVSDDRLTITVMPGLAVDGRGRVIAMPAKVAVDPFEPTPPYLEPGFDSKAVGIFTLWLCYRESLTDYTPTVSASDGQEDSEAGTIVESYAFRLTQGTPGKAESDLGERFCEAMAHNPGEPAPDPHVVLCQLTQGEVAEPPGDAGIPIATVELLDGQHLGAVDECGVRTRIYSQATLLEIISCLVSKIDKRLSESPAREAGGRHDHSKVGGLERSGYSDP